MAWIYKRKDSDRFWMGYRQNGAQVLESTGQTDKVEAQKVLEKIKAMLALERAQALTVDVFQQISGRKLPTATLKAALESWTNEARGSAGPRTVEKYQALADSMIKHFRANEQGPLVSNMTREELQEFLNAKRATVSASTANMSRKCLSVFFRRCKTTGATRENPMEGIKAFKPSREEKRVRRPFSQVELAGLYQQAPDDFWRYMVLAGFFTGLRLGDLVTIPFGAIDFKKRTINLLSRKTDTQMRIPIADPLFAILSKLKRNGVKPTDPVWPEHAARYEASGAGWFSQRFYDLLLVKAGLVTVRPHRSSTRAKTDKRVVNEVSFHCFRLSYVSTLAALGHNQQIVKALAGHSSDEINDLYTKVPPAVLKDAVALLPDITKGKKLPKVKKPAQKALPPMR